MIRKDQRCLESRRQEMGKERGAGSGRRLLALLMILAVLSTGFFTACGGSGGSSDSGAENGQDSSGQSSTDQDVPLFSDFTAWDLEGDQVDQSILAGHKLTMMTLWGTYCGFCIAEMPGFSELNAEYEDEGFQVVGIVMDVLNQDLSVSEERLETAREIVEANGAEYLHLIPSETLLMTGIGTVSALPASFFVDEEGRMVSNVYMGAMGKEKFEEIIVDLLDTMEESGEENEE